MEKSIIACIYILLVFLQLLLPLCIATSASSSAGANIHQQNDVDEELEKRNQEFMKNEHNPQKYIISIGVKFSDGSEIFNFADMRTEHKDFFDHKMYLLEEVLKATNGIEVEYIENPKMKAAMEEVKRGNLGPFAAALHEGGYVKFKADINQAIVMGEKDGTFFKKGIKGVDFHHKKGEVLTIWELLKEVKKFDDRYYIPTTRHHYYVNDEHLDVFFDGHTMAILSLPFIGSDGKEELKEVARYHFNGNGMNIFLKDGGNLNYLMKAPNTFVETKISVERIRGQYVKNEFRPRLWSRKLSLAKLSEIAFNVVGGRPWGGDFKCHNFIYEFIVAIVDEKDLKRLKQFNSWPESQCILDNEIVKQNDGRSGFVESVLRNPLVMHLNDQEFVEYQQDGIGQENKVNEEKVYEGEEKEELLKKLKIFNLENVEKKGPESLDNPEANIQGRGVEKSHGNKATGSTHLEHRIDVEEIKQQQHGRVEMGKKQHFGEKGEKSP